MPRHPYLPTPEWVNDSNWQFYAVGLAAFYHNPKGSVADLSLALGLSHGTLSAALHSSNGLSKRNCLALEAFLGRDMFPREFFRPDLFPKD